MRKYLYLYMMYWPLLAVLFTVWIDYSAMVYREGVAAQMISSHLKAHVAREIHLIKKLGLEHLAKETSDELSTLDIYVADADLQAITKPRFSTVGATLANKAITRALALPEGGIETYANPSDYRAMPVWSAYTNITLDGKKLAVIAEIDQAEVKDPMFRWWFFADSLWIALFAGLAGVCLYVVREDVVRVVKPHEEVAQDGYTMLIKAIRQFPANEVGVALVQPTGLITDCSPSFARILGAMKRRERVGTVVHKFHSEPERHRQLFESFRDDLVERPVTCVDIEGKPVDVFLSVTRLNGAFMVMLRRRVA